MGNAASFLIRPRAALTLGRVSNLPTLLSNALAGAALCGGARHALPAAIAALMLFYVGGMYLNDACDALVDARERPQRPIPRGEVARGTVFAAGFVLLACGLLIALLAAPAAGWAGTGLIACIVLYDVVHKRTALAPLIMGLCRLLCYGTAALIAGGRLDAPLLLPGALGLFCHVIGLTYAARQESYDRLDAAWPLAVLTVPLAWALWMARTGGVALVLWIGLAAATVQGVRWLFRRGRGDVPRAVSMLIAAISLYDSVLIAGTGELAAALVAALCFPATLALQRLVAGT